MSKLSVYTDGGARGNPGPAAIGIVFLDEKNNVVKTSKTFLGKKTNNQAEYNAVIKALKLVEKIKPKPKELAFFLDSELVCRQITGEYKIKNADLKVLNKKTRDLIEKTKAKITFKNVSRENPFIQKADELVNECLDGQ